MTQFRIAVNDDRYSPLYVDPADTPTYYGQIFSHQIA